MSSSLSYPAGAENRWAQGVTGYGQHPNLLIEPTGAQQLLESVPHNGPATAVPMGGIMNLNMQTGAQTPVQIPGVEDQNMQVTTLGVRVLGWMMVQKMAPVFLGQGGVCPLRFIGEANSFMEEVYHVMPNLPQLRGPRGPVYTSSMSRELTIATIREVGVGFEALMSDLRSRIGPLIAKIGMMQIAQGYTLHFLLLGLRAIVQEATSKNLQANLVQLQKAKGRGLTIRDIALLNKMTFGVVQTVPYSVEQLMTKIGMFADTMQTPARPDVMLIPPEVGEHLKFAPERIRYDLAGPAGPNHIITKFEEAIIYQNYKIVVVSGQSINGSDLPQMFTNDIRMAMFVGMRPVDEHTSADDTWVYNSDKDETWYKVSVTHALENSQRFDAFGNVRDFNAPDWAYNGKGKITIKPGAAPTQNLDKTSGSDDEKNPSRKFTKDSQQYVDCFSWPDGTPCATFADMYRCGWLKGDDVAKLQKRTDDVTEKFFQKDKEKLNQALAKFKPLAPAGARGGSEEEVVFASPTGPKSRIGSQLEPRDELVKRVADVFGTWQSDSSPHLLYTHQSDSPPELIQSGLLVLTPDKRLDAVKSKQYAMTALGISHQLRDKSHEDWQSLAHIADAFQKIGLKCTTNTERNAANERIHNFMRDLADKNVLPRDFDKPYKLKHSPQEIAGLLGRAPLQRIAAPFDLMPGASGGDSSYLDAPLNRQVLIGLVTLGLPLPMQIFLVWPYISVKTQHIVVTLSGATEVLWGNDIATWGDETQQQVRHLTATASTGTKMSSIGRHATYCLRDVLVRSINGGWSCSVKKTAKDSGDMIVMFEPLQGGLQADDEYFTFYGYLSDSPDLLGVELTESAKNTLTYASVSYMRQQFGLGLKSLEVTYDRRTFGLTQKQVPTVVFRAPSQHPNDGTKGRDERETTSPFHGFKSPTVVPKYPLGQDLFFRSGFRSLAVNTNGSA